MSLDNTENLLELSGQVEAVIYRNEQNGYTVIEFAGEDSMITATGTMPLVSVGETVRLVGVFRNHPSYGEQFAVSGFERAMPENLDGILKYLSSGAIKGIGPSTARRLVEAFGVDTLAVLENEPMRVAKLRGISESKALDISEQLRQVVGMRELMVYLAAYSIPPSSAVKLWKRYGTAAVTAIEENPYLMCEEGLGISFETADRIALAGHHTADERIRVRAGLAHVLSHNRLNGHTCLPADKLCATTASMLGVDTAAAESTLDSMIEDGTLSSDIFDDTRFIFLPALYDAERYIASRLQMLRRFPAMRIPDAERKIRDIESQTGITYAALQKDAITAALSEGLLILTGGPGTGKTTTLNAIIRLLRENGQKVMLCAPTGRAAQRMTAVTGVEAKTIHRMLEASYDVDDKPVFKRNERNLLSCDALVIDEMSMVDCLLLESVMRAIPLSCRLILVGDSNQLPSVGAGNVLADLIASETIPVISLREIFRQSMQSLIVTNAHRIIDGVMPDIGGKDSDFFFLHTISQEETAFTVSDLCTRRLPESFGYTMHENIQVLSPTRKGMLGTMELNTRLQNLINPHPSRGVKVGYHTLYEGDKVMQSRNNYDILWTKENGEYGEGVFNGDIGVLTEVNPAAKSYKVRFDDKTATYDSDTVSDLELAYACTVHKSQGNEFDCVVLPMSRIAPQLMYRNLLYTAVTRARKLLVIVGDESALRYMVENNRRFLRYSGLKVFLVRGLSSEHGGAE